MKSNRYNWVSSNFSRFSGTQNIGGRADILAIRLGRPQVYIGYWASSRKGIVRILWSIMNK